MIRSLVSFSVLLGLISCGSESSNQTSPDVQSSPSHKVDQVGIDLADFIANDYLMDDIHSYVGFKINYFGNSPVRGRFDVFDGTLFYNDNHPGGMSASIFVDVNSINSGNERRDKDLISEDSWFDAVNYPVMSFISDSVTNISANGFDLHGVLTIKGISKSHSITFKAPTEITRDWAKNHQVDFSGSLIINRQDYGIVGGDFWSSVMENGLTQLSDEVEIELDIHCRKADYAARYEDSEAQDTDRLVLDRIRNVGIDEGLSLIDSLYVNDAITAGKISSIGYTLNAWSMYAEAERVFTKRLEHYPGKSSTHNQLGITRLLQNDLARATEQFKIVLEMDTINSRAFEYLRLIDELQWNSTDP